METEKLEKWFDGRIQQVLEDGSEYPIFLVAIGEKPGALTMNVDREQEEVLRKLSEELDLSIKVSEGRVSKPGVNVGSRPEHNQRCAFIAQNSERFEILEESDGRFYGFSDRAVGEFLGFPDSAISFFSEHEQPGMISKKGIENEEMEGKNFLGLTTFIPDPERLEEAIEIGRERKKALEQFDEKKDAATGRQFIRKRTEDSMY